MPQSVTEMLHFCGIFYLNTIFVKIICLFFKYYIILYY
uniref:Uncharacterized protein n=1 Tax=CrAss-like virus sp. ctYsL76 TaxID=2826826 RepID=A0A8S5QMK4_9CAUD|nr:MAG TPA: hypothetical protein [CrAss-like virus sp. ctYsL76]